MMERKIIFHSSRKPPFLLGGFFILLGLLFWHSNPVMGISFAVSGILPAILLNWRIIFTEETVILYSFGLMQTCCRYTEINSFVILYMQMPECKNLPNKIIFNLKSGRMKTFHLGLFSPESAKSICEELNKHATLANDQTDGSPVPPERLFNQVRAHLKHTGIILGIFGFLCVAGALYTRFSISLLPASLICLIPAYMKIRSARKLGVPRKLIQYQAATPQKKRDQVLGLPLQRIPLENTDPVCTPFALLKGGRFGYFLPHRSAWQILLCGIPFVLSIAGIFLQFSVLGCSLMAFVFGFFLFSKFSQAVTIFDLEKKQLFRCRSFNPEKPPQKGRIDFTSICSLQLCYERRRGNILLFGAEPDGSVIPICVIAAADCTLVADSIPELADRMGKLPIVIRV